MFNKVILMGRFTKDPEIRTTQSGHSVCRFNLAVDRRFKDADGNKKADFPSLTAWRQTADFIYKYFRKGDKILIVGNIQTGNYDKDGHRIYTTEVVVNEAYFVESNNQQQTQVQAQPQEYDGRREAALLEALEETELPFSMD